MRFLNALVIAFATYSRLPMPRVDWSDENRRYALCFFPLIGLVAGGLLTLWLMLCDRTDIQPLLRGGVGAAIPLLVTGGIHMDGLMDTSDALASWQPREKRLEILKDHHVGAFAVMVCAGYLLVTAGLLAECTAADGLALTACFLLSRAVSAALSVILPQARPGGMLDGFARTAAGRAVRATAALYAFCGAAALLWDGARGVAALAALVLVIFYYCRMARKQFGGVTGDLAGWFLQMAELALTAALVIGGKLL